MENGVFERLSEASPAAFAGVPVVFAYLFGSEARGEARPGSDVDVAVYLDPAPADDVSLILDLAGRLEEASGVPNIEVVVLNDAPIALGGRVVLERRIVFSVDEPARVEYESRTLREFFDFRIHADALDRELLRRTAEGRR